MAVKHRFASLAQRELEVAAQWYEERTIGLGERFASAIYDAANAISKNPEAYPNKRVKCREFVVRDFPFIIIYEYIKKDNLILVLHVFHTSRHPKLKYKRK